MYLYLYLYLYLCQMELLAVDHKAGVQRRNHLISPWNKIILLIIIISLLIFIWGERSDCWSLIKFFNIDHRDQIINQTIDFFIREQNLIIFLQKDPQPQKLMNFRRFSEGGMGEVNPNTCILRGLAKFYSPWCSIWYILHWTPCHQNLRFFKC